jgi:hypothetical protein
LRFAFRHGTSPKALGDTATKGGPQSSLYEKFARHGAEEIVWSVKMSKIASIEIAERFACALDADDFPAASRLLAEDCQYKTGRNDLRGREQVISSFREASTWARARFETVTYEHALEPKSESATVIRFVDIFEHRGRRLVHVCLMHVAFGTDSLIQSLVLEELPGEREQLLAFLETLEIKR